MGTTRKALSIGAFQLEPGLDDGGSAPTDGWGDSSAIQTLGSGDALSITSMNIVGKSETAENESIDGQAFKDIPNQVQVGAQGSMGGDLRYRGIDKLLYWALGFERPGESPITACQFTIASALTDDPEVDDVYSNNSNEFTITGLDLTLGVGTIYAKRTSGTGSPTTTGDLDYVSGGEAGDDPITYSATTGLYYSHMFELDAMDRHFAPYRAVPDEQTAGDYNVGDRKCRMATIAQKKGPNDHRYPNSMCMKFALSSQAGGSSTWTADLIAYDEDRGDYSSASWTFPAGATGSAYRILHHHWKVSLGSSGSLTDIGVTDFEIGIDIPLDVKQDTESGLYVAEPIGAAKYSITGKLSITRHSVDTYHAYRDAFTALVLKFVATNGNDQFKILMQDVVITEASTTEDDVSPIPLTFAFGPDTNALTPFSYELEGHTIVQDSPILIITNNANSTNEMRRE